MTDMPTKETGNPSRISSWERESGNNACVELEMKAR
ncbi:unnamed protein product [Rhodiola kirilowii]